MSDRTTYVLDTSVLLADGKRAIYSFPDADVVLPLVVLKELEAKRNDPELGLTARSVLRELERLRIVRMVGTSLHDGLEIAGGSTIRIEVNHVDTSSLPHTLRNDRTSDHRILAVALALRDEEGQNVVLVSNDIPMRILADGVLDIRAEEYRASAGDDDGYSGIVAVEATAEQISEAYSARRVRVDDLDGIPNNTGVVLHAEGAGSAVMVLRDDELLLVDRNLRQFGLAARSKEQAVALHHLASQDIDLVSLGGPAGTGKSALAIAAGLQGVMEDRRYRKVQVFRPIHAVGGQDLGYLPGSGEEKMDPWAAAVYDTVEGALGGAEVIAELRDRKVLEVLPLTHIRGRTLTDAFVIVDEAQNLERGTILSMLSRLGSGSKAVLCWDVTQRDNLHVGRHDGVHAVVESLKGEDIFAHVTLRKTERSRLAQLVVSHLDLIA